MKKLIIILTVLFLIMPMANLKAEDYIPLTRMEVIEWLEGIEYDELLDYIILWDYIEHINADVMIPQVVCILDDKGNLYVNYNDLMTIEIGYLRYDVVIQDQVIEDFYSYRKDRNKKIIFFLGGVIGGALTTVLLLK